MVELCIAQRIAWTSMAMLIAVVATVPRLQWCTTHGKLLERAPRNVLCGRFFGATVPKRWFSHFYLLGLVSTLIILVDMFVLGGDLVIEQLQSRSVCSKVAARSPYARELGAESMACLLLLLYHLCRRLWECLTITRWGSSRMFWSGYLVNDCFSRAASIARVDFEEVDVCIEGKVISMCATARNVTFCFIGGGVGPSPYPLDFDSFQVGLVHYQLLVATVVLEAPRLTSFGDHPLSVVGISEWGRHLSGKTEFRHIFALGLFTMATARQHGAIRHLASLRDGATHGGDTADRSKVKDVYGLPTEGWFRYVSCPHYLAEIMIYASFWLIAGARGGTLGQGYQLVLTWVFSNQAFVAARAHSWYQRKFEDYPRRRRRLIPGIW